MTRLPFRFGAVLLIPVCGFASGAFAQTVDGTSPSAVPGQPVISDLIHTDSKGRHLAPHGTLYLLEYVSVQTDKGVEGFEPGQEVHVVEVHRATHMLVVSNGRAQVEVSPSKLTHDMDIAALVRMKDQANQAQIAAYVQAEEAAYHKAEKEAAIATAKDMDQINKDQVASSRIVDNTGAAQPAQAVDATTVGGSGYYGSNGYGYGSPYSYFEGGGESIAIVNPATAGAAPAAAPAAGPATGTAVGSGSAGKVAAPSHAGGIGKAR